MPNNIKHSSTSELSKSDLELEIINQIYKVVENLGGKSDILAIIGSYGDTLDDNNILSFLKTWNRLNSTNDS
jgi:hypothetical protein